jgi:hypothetical protein
MGWNSGGRRRRGNKVAAWEQPNKRPHTFALLARFDATPSPQISDQVGSLSARRPPTDGAASRHGMRCTKNETGRRTRTTLALAHLSDAGALPYKKKTRFLSLPLRAAGSRARRRPPGAARDRGEARREEPLKRAQHSERTRNYGSLNIFYL